MKGQPSDNCYFNINEITYHNLISNSISFHVPICSLISPSFCGNSSPLSHCWSPHIVWCWLKENLEGLIWIFFFSYYNHISDLIHPGQQEAAYLCLISPKHNKIDLHLPTGPDRRL